MMPEKINAGIRAVIFDVDGTLYHQRPVRLRMSLRMGRFFLCRPWRWRELLGIIQFRRVREEKSFRTSSLNSQILEASHRIGGISEEKLQSAIQRWMFEEPLDLIRKYPKEEVLSFLQDMQKKRRRIVIYSDYPPESKLAVLDIIPDAVYYPGSVSMMNIHELKPSRKAMEHILDQEGLTPEKVLYVGDRLEKDGKSAEMVGMHFLLVT